MEQASVKRSAGHAAANHRMSIFCPAMEECGNDVPDEELVQRSL